MLTPDHAKKLVFDHYPLLKKMASESFRDRAVAEEALNYVLDHLQENEWASVCQYANPTGRGFTVFLHHIVKMRLINFARKIGHIPHIPKWVTERGEFWQLAYRLLIVEQLPRSEIRERLTDYAKREGRQLAVVEEVIQLILQKSSSPPPPPIVGSTDVLELQDPDDTPPEKVEEMERLMVLEKLFVILEQLQESPPAAEKPTVEARVSKLIIQLRECITLETRDLFLLKMVFQDGLTVSEAGRRLNWNVVFVQNRFRQLLKNLRKAFERCGVAEEFRMLFE